MKKHENLSDSRGNAAGVAFFRILLKIIGINRTCEFVWVVTFFYALFDSKARAAARHYLAKRFPEAGKWKMFYHTWALFTSLGQSMIECAAWGTGKLEWKFSGHELSEELMAKPGGFILLTSHFGAWNTVMGGLNIAKKPVKIVVTPDRNANVDKTTILKHVKIPVDIISTNSPMGGLLDVTDALDRGEIVCIMGDRCLEGEGIEAEFLGHKALFPGAAFYIAARTGCPVLPLFAVRLRRHDLFLAEYGPVIRPVMKGRSRASLKPYLDRYLEKLESLTMKYPYQNFLFEDIWKKEDENSGKRGIVRK